jgi:hypothetical protein
MSFGMVAAAGIGLVGASMSADAAGDASELQAQGTRDGIASQERQFQQVRTDQEPYRNFGGAAVNKLSQLLGLGAQYGGQRRSLGDIRAELAKQNPFEAASGGYSGGGGGGLPTNFSSPADYEAATYGKTYGQPNAQTFTDYNTNLDQLAQKQYGDEEAAYKAWQAEQGLAAQDDDYGSLLRDFTGDDLENDQGYKFGLREGQQGIDRRAASGGNYFSGAALKEAARYGNDYAGTKFNEAWNRDSAGKTQKYNFLSTGQNAAAQTGNAGMNMANQVTALTTGNANAQGAARIAQGNAWSGGIQNAVDGYRQNELVNKIMGGNASGWNNPNGWRGTSLGNHFLGNGTGAD